MARAEANGGPGRRRPGGRGASDREAGPAAGPGPSGATVVRDREGPPPVPRVTLALMGLFLVGGSVALLADWPTGPAHVSWGVWLLVYGGYLYVVAAALYYVLTGK